MKLHGCAWMCSLCKTKFTRGQKDTEQAGTGPVLHWAATMRFSEIQGKAGEVGKHYRNFSYFACNAVISIHVIRKSSHQQSYWSWGIMKVRNDGQPHVKTLCCWGSWPWFWAPAMKSTVGCSSGIFQWCSYPAKCSHCKGKHRSSSPRLGKGKGSSKAGFLWDRQTTGRQLGTTETQTVGESLLNLSTLVLVSQGVYLLCFTCLLEVSLLEVTQCEHGSATTPGRKSCKGK